MFNFRFFYFKSSIKFIFFIRSLVFVLLSLFQRRGLALGFQFYLVLASNNSQAFLAETLELKKQMEGAGIAVKSFMDTVEEAESLLKIEKDFLAYEKELKEFKQTLDEYENLGLDVKDFIEFRKYDPNSFKEQLEFLKDYVKRAKKLLESLSDVLKSPSAITATEQIETNRTLRALLEDNQTRELRKLRREIAKQKLKLERRKKEQEFITKQYSYINRHSKKTGFGVFHPFTNKNDLTNTAELTNKNESKNKTESKMKNKHDKRKKFLGIF
ncbi:MAG: hypothetical protein OXN83_03655 [Oligoflexia bacterium]|nr:hypothetical protein [Oligoflexia bacterium]